MKFAIFIFSAVLVLSNIVAAQTPKNQNSSDSAKKNAVLVELFTSEGCSSCPPADRVLTQLDKNQSNDAEIITLAWHVDYWNYLGWKDEYSSKSFSQRQSGYADRFDQDSVYTPQMVVDGQTEFVGSNLGTAQKAIANAAKNPKATIDISFENETNLKAVIADLPAHDDSYVWLAITENNLSTNVRGGENSGRKLEHTAVVREMKLLGNLAAADKSFEAAAALTIAKNWKKDNLRFVVFVQGKTSKKIFGASRKSLV